MGQSWVQKLIPHSLYDMPCVLFILENLTSLRCSQPYLPTSGSSTTFRSAPPAILTLSNSAPALSLHLSRARVPFSDFDDHLEDVRLDWLQNKQVEEALKGVKVVNA